MTFYRTIIFVLFSVITFSTYAQSSSEKKSLKESATTVTKAMNQEAAAIANLTEIELDCELEAMCIYRAIEALAEKEPNSFYQSALTALNANMKQIEFEHQHCNSEQIKATRKVIATCTRTALSAELAKPNENASSLKQSIESCVSGKGKELAEKGNIYAQDMLATMAQKSANKNELEKWNAMIEAQKGSPEYKTFSECSKTTKK